MDGEAAEVGWSVGVADVGDAMGVKEVREGGRERCGGEKNLGFRGI